MFVYHLFQIILQIIFFFKSIFFCFSSVFLLDINGCEG